MPTKIPRIQTKTRRTINKTLWPRKKQVHQQNIEYDNQNTKYANQNTKYANQKFMLFCREAIFVVNLRTFLVYFLQAKKYGGVQKKTNMRYESRRSILVNGEETWVKKGEDLFNVTMGAFDGAEVCDTVGLYLLSQIRHLPAKGGLYRDDGLLVSSLPPKQVHKLMEEIIAIFESNGLQLKAKCNTTVANFLDITLDLKKGQYMPYRKPGTPIEYIHIDSNHPRHVTKNTVAEVSKRLSALSF